MNEHTDSAGWDVLFTISCQESNLTLRTDQEPCKWATTKSIHWGREKAYKAEA